MVVRIGFWKNPLQPKPRARIRSVANEPAMRSLFLDGIII